MEQRGSVRDAAPRNVVRKHAAERDIINARKGEIEGRPELKLIITRAYSHHFPFFISFLLPYRPNYIIADTINMRIVND